MIIKRDTIIAIGQGVCLLYKQVKQLGMEVFMIVLLDRYGNAFKVATFMSESGTVTRLSQLLREPPSVLVRKYANA